jgi:hypothetical protein
LRASVTRFGLDDRIEEWTQRAHSMVINGGRINKEVAREPGVAEAT